jgi:hypothetical protein
MPLRFPPSPAVVLSAAALFLALGGSAFGVGERVLKASAAQQRCATGAVRGIAVVTNAGAIPSDYRASASLFARRFNCRGRGVQIRKAGTGLFDIRFPGISNPTAVAAAISVDVASASAQAQPDGSFRIRLRSGHDEDHELQPIDAGFVLIVF